MTQFFRLLILVSLCLCLPLINDVEARNNLTFELRNAQKALAAGEYKTAFQEYMSVAKEKKNPLAQFTIGLFFQLGWGREIDHVTACEWFGKAAAGNIPAAAHFYAECLNNGVGQTPDPAQAAVWYEKAASLGHFTSICSLAELYMEGSGVPKDPVKALSLCQKATNRGIVPAQTQMGKFLLEGDDSIRDFTQALGWFQLAAQNKSLEAQYYLGVMARDGKGQPKANETSIYWFELAASQGYVPAYLQTSQLYFNTPVEPETEKLSDHNLAKAYLWLTATAKMSIDKDELSKAAHMLKQVLKIIPATWLPSLDKTVSEHLAKYPAQ